jgi:hypothetical protein
MHKKLRVKNSLTIKGQTIRILSGPQLSEVAGGNVPPRETKGSTCACPD